METEVDSYYLAIDPGETIGYATFGEQGQLLTMDQFRFERFNEVMAELLHSGLKHVIIEEYVNYGHKQQKRWSKNETSKIIGKIELLADLRGVSYTRQPANNYPIGAKWGGFEIPSNHSISHQFVAAAHGIFWLQKNGIRSPGQAMMNRNNDD